MSNFITKYLSKTTGRDVSNIQLINTIRELASQDYKAEIPVLDEKAPTINVALAHANTPYTAFTANKNEFIDILINRIGATVIRTGSYEDPLAVFANDNFEYGSTLQELFTEPVKGENFNGKATTGLFDIYDVPVHQFFHDINNERVYPISIEYAWTAKAFTSEQAFDEFVNSRMEALIAGDVLDEFKALKGVLGNALKPTTVSDGHGGNKDLVIKGTEVNKTATDWLVEFGKAINKRSILFNVSSEDHTENAIEVPKATPYEEQYLIVDADTKVELDFMQANAFNMDKTNILARVIVVDKLPEYHGGGDLDGAKPFAMLVSKKSIIFSNKLKDMEDQRDAKARKINVFYHHHYLTSFSLIENAHVFYTK